MDEMIPLHDRELVKKNEDILKKQKGEMSYYFSLHPHEQIFLDRIVFDGRSLIEAYNDAYKDLDNFEPINNKRKALSNFRRKNMQKAFDELNLLKVRLSVGKLGGYFADALENVANIAQLSGDERVQLEANKFLINTYTKNAKDLIEMAKAEGVQINVNNNGGGNVSVINVVASDLDEQHRVFGGKSAKEVLDNVTENTVEVFEHVDTDK